MRWLTHPLLKHPHPRAPRSTQVIREGRFWWSSSCSSRRPTERPWRQPQGVADARVNFARSHSATAFDSSSRQLYLNFPFPRAAAAIPVLHITASLLFVHSRHHFRQDSCFSSKFIRLSVSQKFDSSCLRQRESEYNVLKKERERETRQNESKLACVELEAFHSSEWNNNCQV